MSDIERHSTSIEHYTEHQFTTSKKSETSHSEVFDRKEKSASAKNPGTYSEVSDIEHHSTTSKKSDTSHCEVSDMELPAPVLRIQIVPIAKYLT